MITNPLPAPSSRIHTLAIRYRQPIFAGMKTNRSAKYVTSSIFCTCMRAYSAKTEAENIRNIKWETLGFTNHIAHAHTHPSLETNPFFSFAFHFSWKSKHIYLCFVFYWTNISYMYAYVWAQEYLEIPTVFVRIYLFSSWTESEICFAKDCWKQYSYLFYFGEVHSKKALT